jgi:hypothetical protein
MPTHYLHLLLAVVGLLLVVAPGALATAVQAPEFFGRPSQPRPRTVVRRWAVA